jgi:rhodanese-related sulfurtransferase
MPIADLSATDARARQLNGAVVVDVRSTREFVSGHPEGAVNVPLLEHDEDSDQLLQNPDFMRVMKANFTLDTPVLVSCQSGVRSVRASQMLESFGYQDVTNVLGGFGGSRDGSAPGWQPSGLPVETTPPAGCAYQDLLERADRM